MQRWKYVDESERESEQWVKTDNETNRDVNREKSLCVLSHEWDLSQRWPQTQTVINPWRTPLCGPEEERSLSFELTVCPERKHRHYHYPPAGRADSLQGYWHTHTQIRDYVCVYAQPSISRIAVHLLQVFAAGCFTAGQDWNVPLQHARHRHYNHLQGRNLLELLHIIDERLKREETTVNSQQNKPHITPQICADLCRHGEKMEANLGDFSQADHSCQSWC